MDEISHPDAPLDKSLKYARPECERRFLLADLPTAVRIVRTAHITDRYVVGTRLRIRRSVETSDGSTQTIYKLTQKVPRPDGGQGLITTIYLSEAEYTVVAAVPATPLRKTRYSIPPFGVDVFDPPLHGLIMAEVDFTSAENRACFVPPSFAVAEVTDDIRFTGGRLVTTTRDELLALLASFGIYPGT
jgi:CYTH domain-containing protein